MRQNPKRFIQAACAAALILSFFFLNGCTLKIIYNHLDWIIPWYVSDYISLNSDQDSLLEKKLKEALVWHRTTQLAVYSKTLRSFKHAVENGLKRQDLDMMHDTMRHFWQDLVRQIAPDLGLILSTASEEQVAELLVNLEKKQDRYKRKYIDPPPEELREIKVDRLTRIIKHWLGDIRAPQKRIIEKWSFELLPISEARLKYIQKNNARLREMLTYRNDCVRFSEDLKNLLFFKRDQWPEEFSRIAAHNRDLTKKTFLAIDATLTDDQRKNFADELEAMAEIFDELAIEKNMD